MPSTAQITLTEHRSWHLPAGLLIAIASAILFRGSVEFRTTVLFTCEGGESAAVWGRQSKWERKLAMFKMRKNWNTPIAIFGPALLGATLFGAEVASVNAQEMANACPVEGCMVKITKTELVDGEVAVAFEANFKPDISKNHLHVWWGDKFKIQQVSGNAETVHKVKQGEWHPTDEYPEYKTQGATSTGVRDGSKTLCVSASDRQHDILDVNAMHCVDVSGLF